MAVRSSGAPWGGMAWSRPVPSSKMVWRISRAQTVKGKSSAAMELVTRSISQLPTQQGHQDAGQQAAQDGGAHIALGAAHALGPQ